MYYISRVQQFAMFQGFARLMNKPFLRDDDCRSLRGYAISAWRLAEARRAAAFGDHLPLAEPELETVHA
jgi:hypothetical protein